MYLSLSPSLVLDTYLCYLQHRKLNASKIILVSCPFAALQPDIAPKSSENSFNTNINARVRCRACTREAEGASRNLFPPLMHDSFASLY